MNERDLENINQIDMECNVSDDDESFGSLNIISNEDDREIQSKTGIIIDLSDDDIKPIRTITADTSAENNNISIKSNFLTAIDNSNNSLDDFHDFNEIDMETPYADDDEDINMITESRDEDKVYFDDDISGLIDEDMLEERKSKKKITFGEVEDDYWDKLSKKHAKSNKKGAYNASFHLAGNPEKEQDMFNHMMGTDSEDTDVADLIGSDSLLATGLAAIGDANSAGFDAGEAGGGEGCSEALIDKSNYSSKLSDLFDIIGFEIFKNSDDSYVAIDKCDMLPSINCRDLDDLVSVLKPYIDDCIIYPLQLSTNQHFDDYKAWVDWYNEDNKKQFPKCAQDIEICDLLANHLHECIID